MCFLVSSYFLLVKYGNSRFLWPGFEFSRFSSIFTYWIRRPRRLMFICFLHFLILSPKLLSLLFLRISASPKTPLGTSLKSIWVGFVVDQMLIYWIYKQIYLFLNYTAKQKQAPCFVELLHVCGGSKLLELGEWEIFREDGKILHAQQKQLQVYFEIELREPQAVWKISSGSWNLSILTPPRVRVWWWVGKLSIKSQIRNGKRLIYLGLGGTNNFILSTTIYDLITLRRLIIGYSQYLKFVVIFYKTRLSRNN